jgi:WD40 repeat protein
MADRVGQQLGNYRMLRLLGRGGFADVYLGKHLHLNTLAAIKVLHLRLIGSSLEQFRTEARIIASLAHPHIVRVLDFGVEGGVPFLVMDFAPNGTLRRLYPNQTPLAPAMIVPYVTQVAAALQYAHERKLIHRDIKPENMLLGQNHEVLLSDFGLVSTAQNSTSMGTGETAGTIHYMAPEQIQGKPRPASDQYALGVVVYEWLSGTRPFNGTYWEIATQHLSTAPPSLRERVPGISPELEEVVLIALEKDAHRRFASVRAFANALVQASALVEPIDAVPTRILPSPTEFLTSPMLEENALAVAPFILHHHDAGIAVSTLSDDGQLDLAALPTPSPSSISTPAPRRRGLSRRTVLAGLAGLTLAGLTGGGAGWWAFTQRQPTGPETTLPPSPRPLYIFRGHYDAVYDAEWSPDGKYIASAGNDHFVKVWAAATGNEFFSYNPSAAQNSVAWSHDGKRIAFGGEDKIVQVHDVATGALLLTYTDHVKTVHTVAWSHDDRYIASASTDHTVRIWDSNTGKTSRVYTGHVDRVWSALWSPDGRYIASASDDQTVRVWDTTTGGTLTTYRGHTGVVFAAAWSPNGLAIASAGDDTTVQVWNVASGVPLLTYREHTGRMWAVDWSPDGKKIVSGGKDATVRVWDAFTGHTLLVYRNHTATVWVAQWSPDGELIASGSTDMTVQVWRPT